MSRRLAIGVGRAWFDVVAAIPRGHRRFVDSGLKFWSLVALIVWVLFFH